MSAVEERRSIEERVTAVETRQEELGRAFELHERRQETEIENISKVLDELRKLVNNRLPVWATLLMTGMGSMLGMAIGVIVDLGGHLSGRV